MAEEKKIKRRNRATKVKEMEHSVKLTYTDEDRIKIVRMLVDSGMNYAIMHKKTGINTNTIKQWYYRYKGDLDAASSTLIAEKVEIDFARAKLEFLQNNFTQLNTLADKAIKRAIALCEKETDLNKISNLMKVISDLVLRFNDSSQDQQQTSGTTINLIQQSIIELNELKEKNKAKFSQLNKDYVQEAEEVKG
jgi:transposase-like protein|nr:MAG TPA: transposase [Caudoviricetes sp.]